ncbi:MAG TPA: heme o synthase [Gammaproteobacteria bacterium]|jgi:protoheme IX farnesyltransferase|nr:heme o synthase [Gammaproteobacteria bacterium]
MLTKELGNVSDAATPRWRDYYLLTKPGVVQLLVFTAIVGMFLAVPGMVPWDVLVLGSLGIGLTAAAAAVVNQVIDQRIDAQMARTRSRPLPTGRVQERDALTFALVLGVVGIGMLAVFVNALTAVLTFVSLIGYAIVYTVWLKRATPQNIVIGGAAGAAPPVLGWTAVTGHIDGNALLLFLIIFTWTPPHFWALAIARRSDYERVEIPMLPVTHGEQITKSFIVHYTILLLLVTVLPYLSGMSGKLYLLGALLLGFGFMYYALTLKFAPRQDSPMTTFRYSITYLMALFTFLLVDHYVPVIWPE